MNRGSIFVAMILLLANARGACAGYTYSVTAIRPPEENTFFNPRAINDRGDILGVVYTQGVDGPAVVYRNGAIISLIANSSFSVGHASALDAKDEVGGELAMGNRQHAAIATDKGVRVLPDSGVYSQIFAANEAGTFVGTDENHGTERAAAWIDGKLHVLSNIPGIRSEAIAVSNNGEIVGSYADESGNLQGYSWINGVRHDLIAGSHSIQITTDVNDQGDVLGYSDDKSGEQQMGIITSGKFVPLQPLPGGTSYGNDPAAAGSAMNDADQVVGSVRDKAGNNWAALFEDGVTINLNSLIDPKPGYGLEQATDINNRGQILAWGRTGSYLLTPQAIPLPKPFLMGATTLPLLGPALRKKRGAAA